MPQGHTVSPLHRCENCDNQLAKTQSRFCCLDCHIAYTFDPEGKPNSRYNIFSNGHHPAKQQPCSEPFHAIVFGNGHARQDHYVT